MTLSYLTSRNAVGALFTICFVVSTTFAQQDDASGIDTSTFYDSAHHWYDIGDEDKIITPVVGQQRYQPTQVREIAENVLLFQKTNGGWPKNYDMRAVLTTEQRDHVQRARMQTNTTFDNGATHSQVDFLAHAYSITHDDRYKDACLRGIDFILRAQYPNGGFPQYFPDTSDYRKHITFNDGVMIGVMKVLKSIVDNEAHYAFITQELRQQVRCAYDRGVQCVLDCQIVENGVRTVWCQQHDHRNFRPQDARTFEKASICNGESAEVVLFLMSIENPSAAIVDAVKNAVQWFSEMQILGIRVKTIPATREAFAYHTTSKDLIVVNDSSAQPIWPRFNELGTHRPVFFTRKGESVYSLAEVERERRTGYAWYTYGPQEVINKFDEWKENILERENNHTLVAESSQFPRDTSFTLTSEYEKVVRSFPYARIVEMRESQKIITQENIVYASYGNRKLHLDLFRPAQEGKQHPAVLLIHGGGWYSGEKSLQVPIAQELAMKGYVAATVEYRLSPEAQYPAAVHDLKAAIRWLRANASNYGIDGDRIAALGCSAGGHLAAFLGVTSDDPRFEGSGGNASFSSRVQAVVDIDGILDFTHPAESGKDTLPERPSAGKRWLGASYTDNPQLWIEASPLTHVDKHTAPILFVNSSIERFHAGRDEMIGQMEGYNIETQVNTIPNTPHTFWLFDPWFETTVDLVSSFLDRVLKRE